MMADQSTAARHAGPCRPDQQFVAYVLGELAAGKRQELERHSRTCPECRLRLASFRAAGSSLDQMFSRAPRRTQLASAEKILAALLSQFPEQKLYYDVARFPSFGTVIAAATERGLCFISFRESGEADYLERWTAADFTVVRQAEALARPMDQLARYFAGRLRTFDLPLDLRFATDFTRTVLAVTAEIGYGKVRTYQDIARAIRKPRATRAVGNALGRNPIPIVIPCHRVVASGGELGGFTGGLQYKRKLLRIEGIEVGGGDLFS
jgi:methylated-DNA-[protein]-cysteine S-methyltransferase